MKTQSLLDVVEIIGNSVSSFENEKYYLDTGSLKGDVYDINKLEKFSYNSRPSRADLIASKGDVIVARMKGTNKVLMVEDEHNFLFSTGFIVLRVKDKTINRKFLYYYLKSSIFQDQKDKFSTGATQKAINNENFKLINIPTIPLSRQESLIKILDEINSVLRKRQNTIKKLDLLLEATFFNFFGDPVNNSKGFEMKKIGDISESRLGKMRDAKQITGNFLKPYLGNSNVRWFSFDLSELLEMDFTSEEQKKFELKNGDLLLCEGGEIGRCAIWREQQLDCYFQKAIHRIRVNRAIVLPEYLQWVMYFYSKANAFKESRSQATIAHLTGVKLKRLTVPVPDITLQQEFLQVIKSIEKLMDKLNNSEALIQKMLQSALYQSFTEPTEKNYAN